MSEPRPTGEPPEPTAAPSPPEEPPARAMRVVGVARAAVDAVVGLDPHRQLRRVGDAERDEAGVDQPLRRRRGRLGAAVAQRDEAGAVGHATQRDRLLDRARHAEERRQRRRRPAAAIRASARRRRRARRRSGRRRARSCAAGGCAGASAWASTTSRADSSRRADRRREVTWRCARSSRPRPGASQPRRGERAPPQSGALSRIRGDPCDTTEPSVRVGEAPSSGEKSSPWGGARMASVPSPAAPHKRQRPAGGGPLKSYRGVVCVGATRRPAPGPGRGRAPGALRLRRRRRCPRGRGGAATRASSAGTSCGRPGASSSRAGAPRGRSSRR